MPQTIVTFAEQNIRRILHLTPEPHRTKWRVRIKDHGDHSASWPWDHYPRGKSPGASTPEEAVEATVERLRALPEVKRFEVERVKDSTV